MTTGTIGAPGFECDKGRALIAILKGTGDRFASLGSHGDDASLCKTLERGVKCLPVGPAAMDPDHPVGAKYPSHHRVFVQLDLSHGIDRIREGGAQQHSIRVAEMVDDHQRGTFFREVLHAAGPGLHGEQCDEP